ncbi:MAG: CRTAC1 family protein, partial [Verrucomicrobia bacterium]|nr:CRTAC1 family protein [Verrucomicrobiota bacterium]
MEHGGAPEETEELAHYDDAIIGRALRWSLVVFLFLGAAIGGLVLVLQRKPAPRPLQVTPLSAPVDRAVPKAEIPVAKFTDVTAEAGIRFVHNSGAYGEKLLPETMGGGVAFFDYDNDGHPDLLFVNSCNWPWHNSPGDKPTTLALYHNDGTG